ncbi:hypothetical protein ROLI_015700 [Roseobacter fucihabitans]|uniref:Uncharacterized protein n=1 Tax=Roseobacter fucihabitans TaxID=1537242 RepID=A0ABZ2BUD5_9RHOB|nr:hypothetical protein [Roseobacter litoralis]MBC6965388.1 hypothetical protein [Roseobacter litoralis]
MALAQYMTLQLLANAVVDTVATDGGRITPPEILTFLGKLRMLEGVPFNNLVPDEELLPNESIRFFHLDRAWSDALVQGALSVATTNSVERAQLEQLYPTIESEVDEVEREYRAPGGEPVLRGPAGPVSGFLLRSAAVAGWPGLHVRAYKNEPEAGDTEIADEGDPSRIKLLRLERLSPAVLLALFDGIPKVLHIEEPRQGIQFGVNLETNARTKRTSATVPARNVETGNYVNGAGVEQELPTRAAQIPVRFRRGAAGVLDLSNTARGFADASATGMSTAPGDPVNGAEFAMQMIRFPYRQIFAQDVATTATQNDAFKPTLASVSARYTSVLKKKIRED